MKDEIKLLRNCQRILNDNVYPGYPFQMSVIIDMKTKDAWIDLNRKTTLSAFMQRLNNATVFCSLGTTKANKGSWVQDRTMSSPEEILNAESDDFYIDNLEVTKFYFAVNAAIRECRDKDSIIFACVDCNCDYVDCKIFNKKEDIEKYIEEYWSIDPSDYGCEEDDKANELGLPKECEMEIDSCLADAIEDKDYLVEQMNNYLSNKYGYCTLGFIYEVVKDKLHLYNIEWDLSVN